MKKIIIASFVAVLAGASAVALATNSNAVTEPTQVSGQIIVKFRDNRAAASLLHQHGLSDGANVGSTGAHLIKVPAGKEAQLIDALSRNPAIEYAEPDAVATATSDDAYFSSQYALQNDGQSFTNTAKDTLIAAGTADADIDAVEAWTTTTGTGVKVAILDSGVATDNPDISPKVIASANFSGAATTEDNYGHGTHVAGTVAAYANNGIGVAGVCPDCSILNGKVLNDSGSGSTSGIANGIDWAVKNGAKVINMSLGQRTSSRTFEAAVNNAWNQGVVIVAAAGNGGNTTKMYPGAYTNVIAVAATDNNDTKASFSTYGAKWVDVAAPGANIYSTFPNHTFYLQTQYGRSQGYDIANGTSMASPAVAGTAALSWAAHPGTTNASVRNSIESTADKITGTGTYWSAGRVNAGNAVK